VHGPNCWCCNAGWKRIRLAAKSMPHRNWRWGIRMLNHARRAGSVIERRSRSLNFITLDSHVQCQKSWRLFAVARKDARFETLVPPAIGYVGVGFEPMFQFKKIGAGNSTFTISFDQVIQNSLWRRLLDLGHVERTVGSCSRTDDDSEQAAL